MLRHLSEMKLICRLLLLVIERMTRIEIPFCFFSGWPQVRESVAIQDTEPP